jgi:rhomboid protease GluP
MQSQPEILPPLESGEPLRGAGFEPYPQPPRRRRRAGLRTAAPATWFLVGVNCLVYLLMIASGVSPTSPTVSQLLRWGANSGPYVLLGGQWWRLLTAAFVHAGIIHIATNMWCLWNLGLLGESLLGGMGTIAVYILTGISGNLLSVALHPGVAGGPPGVVGVGASGAVFGLAGVLILLLKSPLLPVPASELRQLRRSVIYFALLNFLIGASTLLFRSPIQIDNMAHLGGFLCGMAVGVPLVPRIGAPRSRFILRQWVAFGGMIVLLLVCAFGIASFWR